MPKITKKISPYLFVIVIIFGLAFYEMNMYKRRHEIYEVMESLKLGMNRSVVLELFRGEKIPFGFVGDDCISAHVCVGFASSCRIIITFSNDKLIAAKIRGEDSPNQKFKDAPPDILPIELKKYDMTRELYKKECRDSK